MVPSDPVAIPDATTDLGSLSVDFVRTGLRKRHWWHVLAVTAAYTVDDDTEHLSCSSNLSGSAGYAISLRGVGVSAGQTIIVSTTSTFDSGHTITLTPASGETINGASTLTIVAGLKHVIIQHDGTDNWILLHDGR